MNVGIFGARADHRGLATLTAIMWRCLRPAKTVVVDMGAHSPTEFHDGQYGPDAETVAYDDLLAGGYDFAGFLDGLDVVVTFEIPYDWRLYTEARRAGVRTVQLTMPELDAHQRQPDLPRPDVFALPTPWLADRYPGSPVLPVPCEPFTPQHGNLVVHPGALAMKDRNGTRTVIDASDHSRHHLVIRCQAPPERPWRHARVEVDDLADNRHLFDGAALVVVPRRYGGLSLVIQEAMAAGLPVLVGAHDPYADAIPAAARLMSERGRNLFAKGGSIATHDVHGRILASRIDAVMADYSLRAQLAAASEAWASAHTWAHVRPAWDAVLGASVAA